MHRHAEHPRSWMSTLRAYFEWLREAHPRAQLPADNLAQHWAPHIRAGVRQFQTTLRTAAAEAVAHRE
eukprot:5772118-Lingulodinium_polyedra.AAC.1